MISEGIGKASGKIILMGEHSVVYGEPAIAFPFEGTQVVAKIQVATENFLTSCYHEGPLATVPVALTNIYQLTKKLQQELQTPTFHLTIKSTIPPERGMGSSAAVAVAITRAFFDWQGFRLDKERLLDFVDFSEQIAHGNPSGIDAAATSDTQPVFFERGQERHSFPLNIDAFLLVCDTGILGQTRAAVAAVADLFENQHHKTAPLITQLGNLTRLAKKAIIENQPEQLGHVMTQAQAILRRLSVSDPLLDRYLTLAQNKGVLGAKLTGGGRGGCFLVLTKTREQAEQIASVLLADGVKNTWIQGLGVYQYA